MEEVAGEGRIRRRRGHLTFDQNPPGRKPPGRQLHLAGDGADNAGEGDARAEKRNRQDSEDDEQCAHVSEPPSLPRWEQPPRVARSRRPSPELQA